MTNVVSEVLSELMYLVRCVSIQLQVQESQETWQKTGFPDDALQHRAEGFVIKSFLWIVTYMTPTTE